MHCNHYHDIHVSSCIVCEAGEMLLLIKAVLKAVTYSEDGICSKEQCIIMIREDRQIDDLSLMIMTILKLSQCFNGNW